MATPRGRKGDETRVRPAPLAHRRGTAVRGRATRTPPTRDPHRRGCDATAAVPPRWRGCRWRSRPMWWAGAWRRVGSLHGWVGTLLGWCPCDSRCPFRPISQRPALRGELPGPRPGRWWPATARALLAVRLPGRGERAPRERLQPRGAVPGPPHPFAWLGETGGPRMVSDRGGSSSCPRGPHHSPARALEPVRNDPGTVDVE